MAQKLLRRSSKSQKQGLYQEEQLDLSEAFFGH